MRPYCIPAALLVLMAASCSSPERRDPPMDLPQALEIRPMTRNQLRRFRRGRAYEPVVLAEHVILASDSRSDTARRICEDLQREDKTDVKAAFYSGLYYYRCGRYVRALKRFRDAAQMADPDAETAAYIGWYVERCVEITTRVHEKTGQEHEAEAGQDEAEARPEPGPEPVERVEVEERAKIRIE